MLYLIDWSDLVAVAVIDEFEGAEAAMIQDACARMEATGRACVIARTIWTSENADQSKQA